MAKNDDLQKLKDNFKTGATPTADDYRSLIDRADVGRKAVGASDVDIGTAMPGFGLALDPVSGKLSVKPLKDGTQDKSGLTVNSSGIAVNAGPGIHVGSEGVSVLVSGALSIRSGLHVETGQGLCTTSSGVLALSLANDGGLALSTSDSTSVLALQVNEKTSGLTTSLSSGLAVNVDPNYLSTGTNGLALKTDHLNTLKASLSGMLSTACQAVLSYSTIDTGEHAVDAFKDAPLATTLQSTFSTALHTADTSVSTDSLKGWAATLRKHVETTMGGQTDRGLYGWSPLDKSGNFKQSSEDDPARPTGALLSTVRKGIYDALKYAVDNYKGQTYITNGKVTETDPSKSWDRAILHQLASAYCDGFGRIHEALTKVSGATVPAGAFDPARSGSDIKATLAATMSATLSTVMHGTEQWRDVTPQVYEHEWQRQAATALREAYKKGANSRASEIDVAQESVRNAEAKLKEANTKINDLQSKFRDKTTEDNNDYRDLVAERKKNKELEGRLNSANIALNNVKSELSNAKKKTSHIVIPEAALRASRNCEFAYPSDGWDQAVDKFHKLNNSSRDFSGWVTDAASYVGSFSKARDITNWLNSFLRALDEKMPF